MSEVEVQYLVGLKLDCRVECLGGKVYSRGFVEAEYAFFFLDFLQAYESGGVLILFRIHLFQQWCTCILVRTVSKGSSMTNAKLSAKADIKKGKMSFSYLRSVKRSTSWDVLCIKFSQTQMQSTVGMKECGSVRLSPRYKPVPQRLKDSQMYREVLMLSLCLLPLSRVETVSMGYSRRSASHEKNPEAKLVSPL